MIVIGDTIVSDDLIERNFVCHLEKCNGWCCVEGVSGAPLEKEELEIIDSVFEKTKPFMDADGITEIEKQGRYRIDEDGDWVTPLVDKKKHCAYTHFEKGMAQCAFELAHKAGAIEWKKPISCHLYPVKIKQYKNYVAVNYDQWELCKPACSFGKKLGVPLYEFLKEPLVRRFGNEWYEQLNAAATYMTANENEK